MANERRGSPAARLHALGGFLRSRLAMGRLPDWYEVNAAIEELDEIGSEVVALEAAAPVPVPGDAA